METGKGMASDTKEKPPVQKETPTFKVHRVNFRSFPDPLFVSSSSNFASSDRALTEALRNSEGLENCGERTITLNMLKIGTALLSGVFGKLFEGTYKGKDVAIKILNKPENSQERARMEGRVRDEVNIHAKLNHPNIVGFIGACHNRRVWCIVTEYAKGGSIGKQNGSLSLKLKIKQALGVAKGMAHLHSHQVLHTDLVSDNLLIFNGKSIKIAGFGVARIDGMTPRWMAPEMMEHRPYTKEVDVFCFGIVLWELITGRPCSKNMNLRVKPIIPEDCNSVLREIMTLCWDDNTEHRPPFTEVVRMLENMTKIKRTVCRPRFRCWTQPLTAA